MKAREDRAVELTSAQAEALRRCTSNPDIDGGSWEGPRMERDYEPLVRDGLLSKTTRPSEENDEWEVITYQTTEIGAWALRVFDKQVARKAGAS